MAGLGFPSGLRCLCCGSCLALAGFLSSAVSTAPGLWAILVVGLVVGGNLSDWRVQRNNSKSAAGSAESGDRDVWPFFLDRDHEAAVLRAGAGSGL